MMNSSNMDNLLKVGHQIFNLTLAQAWIDSVKNRNWNLLDQLASTELTDSNSQLSLTFKQFCSYTSIEHIIAIRSSIEDEEGIWHDDGSRSLAFSLSLNFKPSEIKGGHLFMKKFNQPENEAISIETQPFGTLIIFATGQQGWQHRTQQVIGGERIVLAGWCS